MFKWTYCIAPGKPPIPCKEPPTNFDSSVVLWGPPCKHPIIWNSCLVTVDMFHSWYIWTNIHSCEHLDVLHVPWNLVAKVRTHWSVAFPTAFFTYSINFTYCKQWMLRMLGNEGTSLSLMQLSLPPDWPCLDENAAWAKRDNTVNFRSMVGACTRIVEPFKHLLCATAHSQVLVHELQAPMGTCQG